MACQEAQQFQGLSGRKAVFPLKKDRLFVVDNLQITQEAKIKQGTIRHIRYPSVMTRA